MLIRARNSGSDTQRRTANKGVSDDYCSVFSAKKSPMVEARFMRVIKKPESAYAGPKKTKGAQEPGHASAAERGRGSPV